MRNENTSAKIANANNNVNESKHNNGPYIHLDWAQDGLSYALERQDLIVIVDVLRFSSAVVTAVAHGFVIFPVPDHEQGKQLSEKTGAMLARRSGESGISISPISFMSALVSGSKQVVLPSPNGAACSAKVRKGQKALIGCFLNAQAVSEMATALTYVHHQNVTVIACGEQRSVLSGERIVYVPEQAHRVYAIEDYLAAGAIIAATTLHRSAEAEVCARSFQSSKDILLPLLRDSFSGRYLIEHGLSMDIDHAAQLNLYNIVPMVHGGDIVSIE